MTIEIHGFCDDRFQAVKDAFAANFADGIDVGASFAVMCHGKPVVDFGRATRTSSSAPGHGRKTPSS